MRSQKTLAAALALLLVSFVFLYRNVIASLVSNWVADDNYSHGFLVVPIACYLLWERRNRLTTAARQPNGWGFLVIIASLAMLATGVLGAERFLTRVSMLGTIAGTVWFLYGCQHLKILSFPLAFLLLMIPIPVIIFNHVALPLQLLASQFGETTISAFDIPVLREGNTLVMANTTLEIAEACSGIRSLISLLTLGIVVAYFSDPRMNVRTTLALTTVPLAIIANGLRVAGTGIASHYYGPEAAEGFLHTFSGLFVFGVAVGMLLLVRGLLLWMYPHRPRPAASDSGL